MYYTLVNLVLGGTHFYWLFIVLGYMQLVVDHSQLDTKTTEGSNQEKGLWLLQSKLLP